LSAAVTLPVEISRAANRVELPGRTWSWLRRSGRLGCSGRVGADRSNVWIWDFSSTLSNADLAPGDRVVESLWTNADDRLALDRLCGVESSDGVIEGRDLADVRPHSSIPHSLGDLTQLGAVGHDNEVDR
jgi:hypothetical protein